MNTFFLWQYVPNKALFVLYGFILSSMAASSFYRIHLKDLNRYWIGVLGALAFMTSDYVIAYSKFMGEQSNLSGVIIMLLYYAGQYMIMKGNTF